jgi:hypothetical protein
MTAPVPGIQSFTADRICNIVRQLANRQMMRGKSVSVHEKLEALNITLPEPKLTLLLIAVF